MEGICTLGNLDLTFIRVYEETPWFKAKFRNASDRKRIKDLLAVEPSA